MYLPYFVFSLASLGLHARVWIVRGFTNGLPGATSIPSEATDGASKQRENTMGESYPRTFSQV